MKSQISNLKSNRLRLDQALVERGLFESREKAKRAIVAGEVRVNQQLAHKPSDAVHLEDQITLAVPERYVSRGGYKLEHAIAHFALRLEGVVAIDFGAATGGFSDCLLQHGAAKVYAVDVGRGQLAWRLRQDPRVIVMEKTNARDLAPESFPQPFAKVDLIVIDCSFISLQKLLRPATELVRDGGRIVTLVKPQFEAGKAEADKGAGVIRDPAVHERVLLEIKEFVRRVLGLTWVGNTESPLLGPAGNKEFLALIEKKRP